jgi:hypothetical protein
MKTISIVRKGIWVWTFLISAYSIVFKKIQLTCLLSDRSVLLPTSIIITSLPRSVLTSSIHFEVWWNEFASIQIQKYLITGIGLHINTIFTLEKAWLIVTRNVEDDNGNRRVPNVRRNQTTKTLLTRSVPELKSYSAILQVHCLRQEVNSDCCLSQRKVNYEIGISNQ